MIEKLSKPVENAPLILFRILFGCVFLAESAGSLITGWARKVFVSSKTNFSFIYFDWLSFLSDSYWVYFIFAGMIICSVNIIIGYKYKWSCICLFILWGMIYLGQKSHYNNHYYLMLLITFVMIFVPANRYAAVDAKLNPSIKSNNCSQWHISIFIILISVVYFYATIAKFYPDWLDATVATRMFRNKTNPSFLIPLYKLKYFPVIIAYLGIIFDGLIIPALFYKRTRWLAVIASLFFHIFNSITLKIGVFPYFALSFCIFFFPANQIRTFFFKKKPELLDNEIKNTNNPTILKYIIIPFILIQLVFPLRHWLIKSDLLFTEEGHRHSWRMMLRGRSGEAHFLVVNLRTNDTIRFNNKTLLNKKSKRKNLNKPDFIWQMAHKIKDYYKKQGEDVAVFCRSSVIKINGKKYDRFIDPSIDLTKEKWNFCTHQDWILEPK